MRSFFVKEIIYIAQALRVWAFFFSDFRTWESAVLVHAKSGHFKSSDHRFKAHVYAVFLCNNSLKILF